MIKKIPTKSIPFISSYKQGKSFWVNVKKSSGKELAYLKNTHKIDARDIDDISPEILRPLIIVRKDYVFFVLLFPFKDKTTKAIHSEKVSFFVFSNKVITVHSNKLSPLKKFEKEVETSDLSFIPQDLVQHILNHLYDYTLPIQSQLARDIDEVEEIILDSDFGDKQIVRKIFQIELQVVDFRKNLRTHSMIMDKLVSVLPKSKAKSPHNDLQELHEYPRIIWTNLESQMEAIDALKETYESLSAFTLNDIMKTLTIISIVIAPMAVIGSIFGMNFKHLPFAQHPLGFLVVFLLMLSLSLFSFIFFKNKKWL